MRRTAFMFVLTGCVCLVASSAAAAPPRSRTVTASYAGAGLDSPADPVPAQYISAAGQGGQTHAVTLATLRTDRVLSVRFTDTAGQPVLAAVVQRLGADARSDVELGRVCGSSRSPLRLARPGVPVTTYLLTGRCGTDVSVPTIGSVTFTFSR